MPSALENVTRKNESCLRESGSGGNGLEGQREEGADALEAG